MNKDTPADPLRETIEALKWWHEHPSPEDVTQFQRKRAARLCRELAALATKPAAADSLREAFESEVAKLPASMQCTILESAARGESLSWSMFAAGWRLATKPAETLTAAHPARRLAVALNALDSYLTDHAPELRDSWEPLIEACFAALATKPAAADSLREALAELVACKDMKDEVQRLRSDPYYITQADFLEIKYERRRDAAWQAARAALATKPAAVALAEDA